MKKNPIKKLNLPLKKMTEKEKDYVAVLMEDYNSNMSAFWEVLQSTKDDVGALDKKLDRKIDAVYEQVAALTERFSFLEEKIASVETEIRAIKKQLAKLTGNTELLESRISAIEKQLVEIKNELPMFKGQESSPVLQKRVEYLEIHVKTLEVALPHLKSMA